MKRFNMDRHSTCLKNKPPTERSIDWPSRFAEMAARTDDPRLLAHYQQSVVPADTPVFKVPLLALDIETTGLDDQRDAIVSIGFIPFDYQRIRCSGARHWIVQPSLPVGRTAATIHGITHSDIDAAPLFDDYFDALLNAMAGKIIVAHCHQIERRFLSAATVMLTGERLHFPAIDTMAIEEKNHPYHRPNLIQRWFGDVDSPSLRLDAARARHGLPPYQPHHALTDALATAELLQAQLQYGFTPQTPVAQLWL